MSIEILKSNTCSSEDVNEILKLVGDTVSQVLKTQTVTTSLFISKSNTNINKSNNLKKTFSIELD
jgi:hypothetical protein